MEITIEKQPLGNAPPIDGPFVEELTREFERAQDVASGVGVKEGTAEEELNDGAHKDEEEETPPTDFVEQDETQSGTEEQHVHFHRHGQAEYGRWKERGR